MEGISLQREEGGKEKERVPDDRTSDPREDIGAGRGKDPEIPEYNSRTLKDRWVQDLDKALPYRSGIEVHGGKG
jgi:hypothetical protein